MASAKLEANEEHSVTKAQLGLAFSFSLSGLFFLLLSFVLYLHVRLVGLWLGLGVGDLLRQLDRLLTEHKPYVNLVLALQRSEKER